MCHYLFLYSIVHIYVHEYVLSSHLKYFFSIRDCKIHNNLFSPHNISFSCFGYVDDHVMICLFLSFSNLSEFCHIWFMSFSVTTDFPLAGRVWVSLLVNQSAASLLCGVLGELIPPALKGSWGWYWWAQFNRLRWTLTMPEKPRPVCHPTAALEEVVLLSKAELWNYSALAQMVAMTHVTRLPLFSSCWIILIN